MKFIQKFVGQFVSKIIMHSQLLPKYDFETVENWQKFVESFKINLKIERMSIDSTNGASIDLCEIYSNTNHLHDKVIIHAMAAGDIYERHMQEYILLAHRFPNYKIVCFNFRNVQASTGTAYSENDWIEDVIAVIENIRKQEYAFSDILVTGHSLGGAIVTIAAARIFAKNCQEYGTENPLKNSVKLIDDRSFSTLTNEILHSVLRGPGSGLMSGIIYGGLGLTLGSTIAAGIGASLLGLGFLYPRLPKFLLKPWIESFVSSSLGKLDALSAYKILPEEAKDYIVAKNDYIIDELSSLHHGLKQSNLHKKSSIREKIERSNVSETYNHQLEELLNLKDSKVCYKSPNGTRVGDGLQAHFLPLRALSTFHKTRRNNYSQINGDEVMTHKMSFQSDNVP